MSSTPRASFNDPKIKKYLCHSLAMSSKDFHASDVINLGRCNITIFVSNSNNLLLGFEVLSSKTIKNLGGLSYFIVRNPDSMDSDVYFDSSFFLKPFDSKEAFLSKAESIERLLEYPEFREWMVWNFL